MYGIKAYFPDGSLWVLKDGFNPISFKSEEEAQRFLNINKWNTQDKPNGFWVEKLEEFLYE